MISVDFAQLALLGVLSTALHWTVARSDIARPLWSRARGLVDKLLRCPACSGFWLGLGLGIIGVRPVTGGALRPIGEVIVAGFLAVFLTPVAEAILLWGLERSAVETNVASDPAAAETPNEIEGLPEDPPAPPQP